MVNQPVAGARDASGTLRNAARSSGGPAVKSEPQLSPGDHQTPVGAPQRCRLGLANGSAAEHQASSNLETGGGKWNRCKYQCCLCDLITLDQGEIETHIATSHNIQYTDYVRQVRKSTQNSVWDVLYCKRSPRVRDLRNALKQET